MMPAVVGLDLSLTATGWANVAGVSGVYRTKATGTERLAALRRAVDILVGAGLDSADLIVIEGYSFGSRNGGEKLGELGGVIRLLLHDRGVRWVEAPPATLKKYATGKGNAGKNDVKAAARKRLGWGGEDDNEADALWLRAIGLELLGAPVCDLPKLQRAAIDGLGEHVGLAL